MDFGQQSFSELGRLNPLEAGCGMMGLAVVSMLLAAVSAS